MTCSGSIPLVGIREKKFIERGKLMTNFKSDDSIILYPTPSKEAKDAQIVSFINMKGGVGKTTLAINIGYTLAKHFDKKVLIIDMDPQFNTTQALMTKFSDIDEYKKIRDSGKTIASVVTTQSHSISTGPRDRLHLANVVKNLYKKDGRLDLIPGDLAMSVFESSERGSERIISSQLEDSFMKKYYDYVLFDTPATYSIYSQSSLLASDSYVVPIAPDIFSSLGYELLETKLKSDYVLSGHALRDLGIIFTLYKESRVKRTQLTEAFKNDPQFENKLNEYEYIRSGNMSTFLLDMAKSKKNIIDITSEFIEKSEHDAE